MSDSASVAAAMDFVARLNAGEVPDVTWAQIEIDEVVVDGCVVVLFGVGTGTTNGTGPVACRVRIEEGSVTDWWLYGAGASTARLRSRTRNAQPETIPARPPR